MTMTSFDLVLLLSPIVQLQSTNLTLNIRNQILHLAF